MTTLVRATRLLNGLGSFSETDSRRGGRLGLWWLVVLVTGFSSGAGAQCFQNTLGPSAPGTYNAGSSPISVAVGDFNGDGKADLAVVNASVANVDGNTVSVLLGTGTGGFGTATPFPVGNGPQSVAVGDFNGDGKADLATANLDDNTVSVLLGTGTGNFGTAAPFPVGRYPVSVAVGDFNGDGKADLATANAGVVNGGNASLSLLLGKGTGDFSLAVAFPLSSPVSVAVGDFNGDGKADPVTADLDDNTVSVLLGADDIGFGFGRVTPFPTGSSPVSVAVGDFNGDGKADLATANAGNNTVSVLLGTGTGGFGTAAPFPVGNGPRSVSVGDFNGDGKADLATANAGTSGGDGTVSVLLGTGTGNFGTAAPFPVGNYPQSVAVGDFNGDGKADLTTANAGDRTVSVLYNCTLPSLSLSASANPSPTCTGSRITLSVTATGGTSPYSYTWAAPAGSTLSATSTSATSAIATTPGVNTFTVTVAGSSSSPVSATVSVQVNAFSASISPTSATLSCANPTATLTASEGSSYQWSTGSTDRTITVSSSGTFSVTVSGANSCTARATTTVTSDQILPTVSLTNDGPLSCTKPSVSLTATGGVSYRFSASATQVGSGPSATVTMAGVYSVTAIGPNGCSQVASTTVTDVSSPIAITAQPANVSLTAGQTARFSVSASGTALSYHWQLDADSGFVDLTNNATYAGVNSATLSVANTTTALNGYAYRVVVSSGGCSATSTSATLIVNPLLTDLSPTIYARPTLLYGTTQMSVVVELVELNGLASTGPITLKITQDSKLSLSLPTSATSVGGRGVNNGVWQLSGPQNGYYTLTTSEPVAAGETLSVGLVGAFRAGASSGSLTVSGTLVGGSGGEQKATNNTDADKIDYFQ